MHMALIVLSRGIVQSVLHVAYNINSRASNIKFILRCEAPLGIPRKLTRRMLLITLSRLQKLSDKGSKVCIAPLSQIQPNCEMGTYALLTVQIGLETSEIVVRIPYFRVCITRSKCYGSCCCRRRRDVGPTSLPP